MGTSTLFDVASSTAAFTAFATNLSVGIGVVVTTTLAVAGALLIIGYAYRKFKQHATGRKW